MTKQIPTSFIYAMDDFLSFTTKTLEDVTTPYYRGKKEDYPIDDSVKSLNAFYSTILFCLSRDITPRQDDIEACGIKSFHSTEELYMRALDIYDLWRQTGLEESVILYCNKMNDIVSQSAISKTKESYALVGDISKRKRDIFDALCKTDSRIYLQNSFDKTYTL